MKRLLLPALALVFFTCVNTQAQGAPLNSCTGNFFTAGASMKLHFAFASSGCTDTAMDACNARGLEIKQDCEYRGEDGGTAYSSCRCQSIRYVKECYENEGCYYGSQLFLETSPECFGIQ